MMRRLDEASWSGDDEVSVEHKRLFNAFFKANVDAHNQLESVLYKMDDMNKALVAIVKRVKRLRKR